mmetsp:Transcript_88874/g.246900  ORF Transcript_88874/g.246900 Transcript_88874/m.246900 type:complete len:217 (+) Transcript_88874:673-1323(+)
MAVPLLPAAGSSGAAALPLWQAGQGCWPTSGWLRALASAAAPLLVLVPGIEVELAEGYFSGSIIRCSSISLTLAPFLGRHPSIDDIELQKACRLFPDAGAEELDEAAAPPSVSGETSGGSAGAGDPTAESVSPMAAGTGRPVSRGAGGACGSRASAAATACSASPQHSSASRAGASSGSESPPPSHLLLISSSEHMLTLASLRQTQSELPTAGDLE